MTRKINFPILSIHLKKKIGILGKNWSSKMINLKEIYSEEEMGKGIFETCIIASSKKTRFIVVDDASILNSSR